MQSVPHLPCEQTWPEGQGILQPPQFAGSLSVSTHLLPQSFEPPRQSTPHLPAEHTCPVGQGIPQPPQLAGSFDVSTQLEPQTIAEAPTQPAPVDTEDVADVVADVVVDVVAVPPPAPVDVVVVVPCDEQPATPSATPTANAHPKPRHLCRKSNPLQLSSSITRFLLPDLAPGTSCASLEPKIVFRDTLPIVPGSPRTHPGHKRKEASLGKPAKTKALNPVGSEFWVRGGAMGARSGATGLSQARGLQVAGGYSDVAPRKATAEVMIFVADRVRRER